MINKNDGKKFQKFFFIYFRKIKIFIFDVKNYEKNLDFIFGKTILHKIFSKDFVVYLKKLKKC